MKKHQVFIYISTLVLFVLPLLAKQTMTQRYITEEILLDSNITYLAAGDDQWAPDIAFDGHHYFVVWTDRRGEKEIYGARFDKTGTLLDSAGIRLCSEPGGDPSVEASVAFDGRHYLVVWGPGPGMGGSGHTYGALIDTSGNIIKEKFQISYTSSDYMCPDVAFGKEFYLVVWQNKGVRVDTSGTVIDDQDFQLLSVSNNYSVSSVDFDGKNFLIAGLEWDNEFNCVIKCARIDTSGRAIDTSGVIISDATGMPNRISIAHGLDNSLVVWDDYDTLDSDVDVYGMRIDSTVNPIDLSKIEIAEADNDYEANPSVDFGSNYYFVTWQDETETTNDDIYVARVSSDGTVVDQLGNAIGIEQYSIQEYPSICCGENNCFLAWKDGRFEATASDIYGTIIDTSATEPDTQDICISMSGNTQDQVSCAYDGTNYLIVWADYENSLDIYGYPDIYCTLVDTTGVLLGNHKLIEEISRNPKLAYSGDNYMCIFETWNWCIGGHLIDITGNPEGSFFYISGQGALNPAIIFDSTYYMVVWREIDDIFNPKYTIIYGQQLDTFGNSIGSIITVSDTISSNNYPDVASCLDKYLVVWKGYFLEEEVVLGIRIDRNTREKLDPMPFIIAEGSYSTVVSDGIKFLVVYEKSSNLYAAKVDTSGTVIENDIPISEATNVQNNPLAEFKDGFFWIAWRDYRNGNDTDFYIAKVDTSGSVLGTTHKELLGDQNVSDFAIGENIFGVYSKFIEFIDNKRVNAKRVMGIFYPKEFSGIVKEKINSVKSILIEASPNIFTNTTEIKFFLPKYCKITVNIYNIAGREVKNLYSGEKASGEYKLTWKGRDEKGRKLPSGIYFLKIKAEKEEAIRKMVLVR